MDTALHGIWVPLVTPMHHGELDLPRLQRLAERAIEDGAHGLVACGTTGEAQQLDVSEQSAVLEFDDAPLAGYLVFTPCYVRPTQEGLLRHFETIADATGRPIVLYNVPARTGMHLELSTARRLAEWPQFAAIKEAGGSLRQMAALVQQTPLSVLCGDDVLLFAALCGGVHRAISAAAHVRTDLYVQLYDLVRAQRLDEACRLADALLPMMQLLFSEPNPAPLKAALEALDALRVYRRSEVRYSLAHATASMVTS